MRKGKLVLLAVAFALAAVVPVSSPAVDKAGLGLDWGIGPNIVGGNFSMKFANSFALSWKVSEAFTVGVFNSTAPWLGEFSYTAEDASDPNLPLGNNKYLVHREGNYSLSGIRIIHTLPGLEFLSAGIELGTASFTSLAATYKQNGIGGAGWAAAFGGAPTDMPTTAPMIGVAGKVSIFKAETKTVTTDINVTGAFRIINITETAVFGTQKAYLATPKAIEGVTSYNNLNVLLGIGLWF